MDSGAEVVIVGGGAGGLELAIRLTSSGHRDAGGHVTLIDRNPTHLWKPRLHEIATGIMVAADEELSFGELATTHGFDFVLGELVGVDSAEKRIRVGPVPITNARIVSEDGHLLPERSIGYDVAVLAMGSTSNDFGTPGVREHCYTLDSPQGAEQIHDALRALAARVKAKRVADIRVIVVGAGLTGVELAAEIRNAWRRDPEFMSYMLPEQLQVTLVEMADRPLPGSPDVMSSYARRMLQCYGVDMRFGQPVTQVDVGCVTLGDGTMVSADMIIWVSGIKGQGVVNAIPGLLLEHGNRVRVNAGLSVLGAAYQKVDGLFAIGDCATCYEEGATKPIPATAQAAHQQAAHLAKSLPRYFDGVEMPPFRYRYRGTLVSLGARRVIADLPLLNHGSLSISGFAARSAYNALYQSHLSICIGWWRTIMLSISDLIRRRAKPWIKMRW